MSAAQELAQFAGGAEVAAEAGKIENANPGAITDAATRLSTAATNTTNNTGEVATAVTALDNAWQGASADQFVAYMARFSKAGADIGQSMTQAADALKQVADAIDGAKAAIARTCDDALRDIKTWIRDHAGADKAAIDDYARGVNSAALTDVQNKLNEADSALSSAAGVIKGATTPASTFKSMQDPTTQPFVPHPGQPVEWAATPPPETKPSGTEGQNGQPSNSSSGTGNGSSSGSGSGGGGHSGGGLGPSGGPPAGGPPPGNVQEWIKQAIEILKAQGINVTDADAQRIWQIIQHESGGNPHAINNWDSNAAAGHPSKGLMQTIDSTFNAHKLPGHDDIYNPVDNIIAGVRYSLSRYGSLANVPGIKATEHGGSYVGY
jgi:WXG100 family type VII secretion target